MYINKIIPPIIACRISNLFISSLNGISRYLARTHGVRQYILKYRVLYKLRIPDVVIFQAMTETCCSIGQFCQAVVTLERHYIACNEIYMYIAFYDNLISMETRSMRNILNGDM